MEDLNDKVTGGTLSADEWNQLPSEVQNLIESIGIVLSGTDLYQAVKAIAGYAGASTWYSESGAVDAYVLSPIGSKQGIAALDSAHDGYEARFRPGNANTGASTVNVNGLGAKAIVREDLSALSSGDLITTRDAVIRYRQAGDHFILANYVIAGSTAVPRGYIDGIITATGTDAVHDIDFGAGVCRDSTDVDTMSLSAMTKQIDVKPWVAGTGNGGFPNALTLTASTWYHMFVIKNPTTGAVDAGFDSNINATNLLADATGYTLFRRIGSVLTDTPTPDIIAYRQDGDKFSWLPPRQDINLTNPGTAEVAHTLASTPLGVRVQAESSITFGRPNTEPITYYMTSGGDVTLAAPSTNNADAVTQGDDRFSTVSELLLTNLTQQIKTRSSDSDSSHVIKVQVHGWQDFRGKQ